MLLEVYLLLATSFLGLTRASPSKAIAKRADLCGDFDNVPTGAYTVYNNHWGIKGADGSQCFGVDSSSGSSVKMARHVCYTSSIYVYFHSARLTIVF